MLILTRGLPGSGKTTWAKSQQIGRFDVVRMNRDDIREMMLLTWPYHLGHEVLEPLEMTVSHIQKAGIRAALGKGMTVIVDDTNLNNTTKNNFLKLATQAGTGTHIEDFRHVPVELCIQRDALRAKPVGRDVILGMWERYIKGKTF